MIRLTERRFENRHLLIPVGGGLSVLLLTVVLGEQISVDAGVRAINKGDPRSTS